MIDARDWAEVKEFWDAVFASKKGGSKASEVKNLVVNCRYDWYVLVPAVNSSNAHQRIWRLDCSHLVRDATATTLHWATALTPAAVRVERRKLIKLIELDKGRRLASVANPQTLSLTPFNAYSWVFTYHSEGVQTNGRQVPAELVPGMSYTCLSLVIWRMAERLNGLS